VTGYIPTIEMVDPSAYGQPSK